MICDLDRVFHAVGDILILTMMSGVAVIWVDYFTGGALCA